MHRDIEAQFLCGLDIEDQQELRWLPIARAAVSTSFKLDLVRTALD